MITQDRQLHVRFNGRSVDIPLADLDVGPACSDRQVKDAAARYLDVPDQDLGDYVLDRHATENMTIRPQAVFG